MVKGGTGWAVQMAVDMNKRVFVYDQQRKEWFTWMGNKFEETGAPSLTKNFAGVGTREINEDGARAIREVYQFTKENLGDVTTVEKIPTNEEIADLQNKLNQILFKNAVNSKEYSILTKNGERLIKDSDFGNKQFFDKTGELSLGHMLAKEFRFVAKNHGNNIIITDLKSLFDEYFDKRNSEKDIQDIRQQKENVEKVLPELKTIGVQKSVSDMVRQEPILVSDAEVTNEINKCR
jgi:hypothetical protein